MAETAAATPPAASGGNPAKKAERWAGKHKVIVGAAGVGAFILLLSQRGKTATIQGAATAPTSETGTTPGSGDDGSEGPEPETPLPPETPATPDPTPTEELPPPNPGPSAPTPIAPQTPTPASAPPPPPTVPVISSNPAESTPASTPTQAPITYRTVYGYYTTIQAYDSSSGQVSQWHHYTSGTRKGDKVRLGTIGTVGKNIRPPASDGWHPGTLNMGDYERVTDTTQYEATQEAVTNQP